MRQRRAEFEAFVEDGQDFDAYVARMAKPGTWAGHMELQAASLLLGAELALHQAGAPLWLIKNHPPGEAVEPSLAHSH